MKIVSRIVLSSLVGVMLVAAAWATTPQPAATQTAAQSEQTQSVSGKIVSFDKTSLTLAVAASNTASQTADQTAKPKSMTFVIDANTAIEGKPVAGASADVTYRQVNGSNLALSIHVAQ